MTDSEVIEIENAVNDAIFSDLNVSEEMISLAETTRKFNVSRLPEGVDAIRVVHIGEFDSCHCISEHVGNTSEIGHCRIISHDYKDGVVRLRYKLMTPYNHLTS